MHRVLHIQLIDVKHLYFININSCLIFDYMYMFIMHYLLAFFFSQHGQTPLHFASYNGMSDTILELTQLGGDINGRDEVR